MMAASLPNCWSAHHMELLLLSTPGGRKGEALCAKSCIIQYLHRKMYLKQGPPPIHNGKTWNGKKVGEEACGCLLDLGL